MWVRRVAESIIVREKQFHACDNKEIATKAKIVLVQANMYQNDSKFSLKLSIQCSYEAKHKKGQKCNTRHERRAYYKTAELSEPTTPRCDVGWQRCKVDVRYELYSV